MEIELEFDSPWDEALNNFLKEGFKDAIGNALSSLETGEAYYVEFFTNGTYHYNGVNQFGENYESKDLFMPVVSASITTSLITDEIAFYRHLKERLIERYESAVNQRVLDIIYKHGWEV